MAEYLAQHAGVAALAARAIEEQPQSETLATSRATPKEVLSTAMQNKAKEHYNNSIEKDTQKRFSSKRGSLQATKEAEWRRQWKTKPSHP